MVFEGYVGDAAASADRLADGWLRTGDLGTLDADGLLRIADRREDLVISGGENVYPAEVEAVLREHPAIVDAAVVGRPDATWGSVPVAVVVVASGVRGRRRRARTPLPRAAGGLQGAGPLPPAPPVAAQRGWQGRCGASCASCSPRHQHDGHDDRPAGATRGRHRLPPDRPGSAPAAPARHALLVAPAPGARRATRGTSSRGGRRSPRQRRQRPAPQRARRAHRRGGARRGPGGTHRRRGARGLRRGRAQLRRLPGARARGATAGPRARRLGLRATLRPARASGGPVAHRRRRSTHPGGCLAARTRGGRGSLHGRRLRAGSRGCPVTDRTRAHRPRRCRCRGGRDAAGPGPGRPGSHRLPGGHRHRRRESAALRRHRRGPRRSASRARSCQPSRASTTWHPITRPDIIAAAVEAFLDR